jgi:hypothetical protein
MQMKTRKKQRFACQAMLNLYADQPFGRKKTGALAWRRFFATELLVK